MNKYIVSTCQRRTAISQVISGIVQILTAITYHYTMTLKPSFFSELHKMTYKPTFIFFLQLPMGIQKAFFINSRTVLSSLAQKNYRVITFHLSMNVIKRQSTSCTLKIPLLNLVSQSFNDIFSHNPM